MTRRLRVISAVVVALTLATLPAQAQSFEVVHRFSAGPNGPSGRLVEGPGGLFYGTFRVRGRVRRDLTVVPGAAPKVDLSGKNLGVVALRVTGVSASGGDWPAVTGQVLDAKQICAEAIAAMSDAPNGP